MLKYILFQFKDFEDMHNGLFINRISVFIFACCFDSVLQSFAEITDISQCAPASRQPRFLRVGRTGFRIPYAPVHFCHLGSRETALTI